MKKKFVESGFINCFLAVDYAHEYDLSNLKKVWHIQVQVNSGEFATFNIKKCGFPGGLVKDIVEGGWFIVECRQGYIGENCVVVEGNREALLFINARRDGYQGQPVMGANYEAPYLNAEWRK